MLKLRLNIKDLTTQIHHLKKRKEKQTNKYVYM